MPHATIQVGARPRRRVAERVATRSAEASYVFRGGEHELVLTSPEIDQAMIDAVARGEAEFALVVEETFLGLCVRFGDAIPWVCSFYRWHSTPRQERIPPPDLGVLEERIPLYVSLADARSGANVAERCITLSMDFSRALVNAIREQARQSVDPGAGRAEMARLRRSCPTTEALAASAILRTRGNL